jgi:circadian clock protein KaiC
MAFGIPRLDEALYGGVLSGSATTLLGAPGTGKTLLGLKFPEEGARQGQPGVYFGFFETPPRLVEKGDAVGIHLDKAVKSGLLEIQWQPPLENNLDSLAERLLERIRERDVGKQRLRLFVDGVSGFRSATVYPDRMGRFLSALTHQLRILDVTTLFSEETPLFRSDIEMPNQELGGAVENVILLRNVELESELHRLASVLKVRESAYDSSIREFTISSKGIEVDGPFEGAEGILTGHPRLLPATAPKKRKKRRLFGRGK